MRLNRTLIFVGAFLACSTGQFFLGSIPEVNAADAKDGSTTFKKGVDTEDSVRRMVLDKGGEPIDAWVFDDNKPLTKTVFYKRTDLRYPFLFVYDETKKQFVFQGLLIIKAEEFDRVVKTAEFKKNVKEWYSTVLAKELIESGKAYQKESVNAIAKVLEKVSPLSGKACYVMSNYYSLHPDSSVRNGKKALKYGEMAVAAMRTPDTLTTLAMALAETGDFEKAIEVSEEAIKECKNPEFLELLNIRLEAFKNRKTIASTMEMKYQN